MPNFPGPYEIELILNFPSLAPIRNHAIRVNCAIVGTPPPGTLFSGITVQKAGGGTGTAQAVVDQLWSFVRLAYHTSVTLTGVTIWKYVIGTYGKDFVSAGIAAGTLTGASATAPVVAQQQTLSFRSANGSVMKMVLLEPSPTGDSTTTLIPNVSGAHHQRIAAYILSADNVALARDDAYPIAALRSSLGQNERIWRKVHRST
jgi:hypothetical protein